MSPPEVLDPDRTLDMSPGRIIQEAAADGVSLTLSPAGTIKARGDRAAVSRWLPVLQGRKPSLVAYLRDCLPAPERPDLPGELVADDGADTTATDITPETVHAFEQNMPDERLIAWYWRSDRYDPLDGRYGGTYLAPASDDIDAVRAYLEKFFGVQITELRRPGGRVLRQGTFTGAQEVKG